MHKAGFVSIVGFPNVGKSTLMNALLGEKLSIISPKAQTTRYLILGIYNDEESQIVFNDTPGYVREPAHKLHEKMNNVVVEMFKDTDVVMYITEPGIRDTGIFHQYLEQATYPVVILINKSDTASKTELEQYEQFMKNRYSHAHILAISALYGHNIDRIIPLLKELLPEHPPYFEKDYLSDRPIRFFVSELIREQIFHLYQQEIPYSTEVVVESYKEKDDIDVINAVIFVERESQKAIIIGKNGQAIKQLGIAARQAIEQFVGKKVYLELNVKVRKNWRNDDKFLQQLRFQF